MEEFRNSLKCLKKSLRFDTNTIISFLLSERECKARSISFLSRLKSKVCAWMGNKKMDKGKKIEGFLRFYIHTRVPIKGERLDLKILNIMHEEI